MLPSFLLTAAIAEEVLTAYLNDNPLQHTAYMATISIDDTGFYDAFEALVSQHISNNSSVFQFHNALPALISTRYLRSTKWIADCLAGTSTY